MSTFIGIDPGLSGAIVAIQDGDSCPAFHDTPVINVGKKGKTKNEYDAQQIVAILGMYRDDPRVVIERQQAMPASLHGREQGSVSTFRIGYGFGIWIGILSAMQIPFEIVAAVSWKSKIMKDAPKEKSASIVKACQLFPLASPHLRRKKDHGRADALLIAEYGRRRMLGALI